MNKLSAKVTKLLITQPFDAAPISVDKLELLLAGIKYDRHFGLSRNSDVRIAKLLSRGIEVANLRTVTLVSAEELASISKDLGFEVIPDDLEANITLSGVSDLTKMQPGTFIKFPRSAIIYITAENLPCVIPAKNMIKRGIPKEQVLSFSKCAMGKRGLTALVFASGFVKTDDIVEIYPPQSFE